MKKELTEQLFNIAPVLYAGRHQPISKNLMKFGFECGDGWFRPLEELSYDLEAVNFMMRPKGISVKATQVKEKFGTLRFYYEIITVLPWWKRLVNSIMYIVWARFTRNTNCFIGETREQYVLSEAVRNHVDRAIARCEDQCAQRCENCGIQFGEWNKDDKVVTKGYIQILCKKCAEKRNNPNG